MERYVSNSIAGTNNNMILRGKERELHGRIFYRVADHDATEYVFSFDNAVDSTFADGSESQANLPCAPYTVLSAFAGGYSGDPEAFDGVLTPLSFDGKPTKAVSPGEHYLCDPFEVDLKGQTYLVFEWTVRGTVIPYTPDKLQPAFLFSGETKEASAEFPQPSLILCKRDVRMTFAFWGDSITQGLQTPVDAYAYWAALIADGLPKDIAFADLGLGFARAKDAATLGVWFEKAKQFDFVNLCFGVNDLGAGKSSPEAVCEALHTAVTALKEAGCRVGMFTVPPIGCLEKERTLVNDYIRQSLAPLCEYVYDVDPILSDPAHPGTPLYRLHPDPTGCRALADDFLRKYAALFCEWPKFTPFCGNKTLTPGKINDIIL